MPLWTAPTIGIFARGPNGQPQGNFLRAIAGMTDYEDSITATGGFESMSLSLVTTPQDAWWWTTQLMASCIVTAPEATTCWEGFLTGVEANINGQMIDINLDDMANRVRCRYSAYSGYAGASTASNDAASIAKYGTKDYIESVGTAYATDAAAIVTARLRQKANPLSRRRTAVGSDASQSGDGTVTLTFAGWYTTLGWVLTSRTDTSLEQTTTQVADLVGTTGVGIGVTNYFIPRVSILTASGVSSTRAIDSDTSYRSQVESLLGRGTSGGERLAWGVYDDRVFTVKQWAGASPSTITYYTSAQTRSVYNATLGTLQPWDIRPDAMVETMDMYDPVPVTGAQDTASRFYCGRVTRRWSRDGWSVEMEPDEVAGIDAILARLG